MDNTNDSGDDEEQLTTPVSDYRALLAVTRPLVITKHTLPSWRGGEICRSGFGTSLEPGDWRAESALRKGEILRPDNSETTTEDEGPATRNEEAGITSVPEVEDATTKARSDLPQTDSNLQIRICLGMS